jgi:hypoxanthine phosphoribosyltransferase
MKTITIHNQAYELYSWKEFGEHVFALSKSILETGDQFDRIIALAKGGTAIVRPIADLCGIKELSSIQIEFYTGIEKTAKTPVITQSLPVKIKEENVLIIDDVADSGETLIMATNYIRQHGASDIKTATLVSKPWTKMQADFTHYTTEAWIIFPWEIREHIVLLNAMWKEKGDSQTVIQEQLKEIGFTSEEIDVFLSS